jgi:hypothetical protein
MRDQRSGHRTQGFKNQDDGQVGAVLAVGCQPGNERQGQELIDIHTGEPKVAYTTGTTVSGPDPDRP